MTNKARRLVREYRQAAVELSWMGSKDPESFDEIRKRFNRAEKALRTYITALEAGGLEAKIAKIPTTAELPEATWE
jgi:hypothetical protein